MQKSNHINLEAKVAQTLFEIGVPVNIRGYRYLKKAIMMAAEDMELTDSISEKIYSPIANQFQTTVGRVTSAVRGAILIAWDRGDLDLLERYFGYTVSNLYGIPTNFEFISLIADKLVLQMKCENQESPKKKNEACEVTQLISNALLELGIPAHLKGMQYLREAIALTIGDETAVFEMTKRVYTPLAELFGTTPGQISRMMTKAIAVSWDCVDLDVLRETFANTVSCTRGYVTNAEFIAMLAERIRLELSPLNK